METILGENDCLYIDGRHFIPEKLYGVEGVI